MFYQSTLVEENTLILCHSFGFSLNKGPNLELWPSLVRGGGVVRGISKLSYSLRSL